MKLLRSNKSIIFLSIAILFFTSALITSSQLASPPQATKTAALNTSIIPQIKQGNLGLALGSPGASPAISGPRIGLLVNDRVGVGLMSTSPSEALDLVGNVFIKGVIKTSGIAGVPDQVLGINTAGTKVEWQNRYAWLTLVNKDLGIFPPSCPNTVCENGLNGTQDLGENCSTCPSDCSCSANAMCVQGTCIFPGDPPPGPPAPGPNCGVSSPGLDPGEECDINAPCSPVYHSCTNLGGSIPVPAQCIINCTCVSNPPANCIPPPPTSPLCGFQGNVCGGVCPNPQQECLQLMPGSCQCETPPPAQCGQTAPQCNGACPPDTWCVAEGAPGGPVTCICSSTQPGINYQNQSPSYLGFLEELGPHVRVAEAATDCTGKTQAPQCPSGWTEYAHVCAEAKSVSFWVRSCFQ